MGKLRNTMDLIKELKDIERDLIKYDLLDKINYGASTQRLFEVKFCNSKEKELFVLYFDVYFFSVNFKNELSASGIGESIAISLLTDNNKFGYIEFVDINEYATKKYLNWIKEKIDYEKNK